MASLEQMGEEFDKAGDKIIFNSIDQLRKFALVFYALLLQNSPVDKGRYRGNHFIDINTNADSTTEEIRSPVTALGSETEELSGLKQSDTIVVSNNLPYAGVLEDGSSTQAPKGIYLTSLMQASLKFNFKIFEGTGL